MNVLVVGSSLIDLFVDLNQNPKVLLENNKVILGLGDKIPVGLKALSLGGNGGNVAAGIKKLGIDTSFYTYLGSDALSQYISQVMKGEGVNVISENETGKTSSLSIILSIGNDRIILSHHNTGNHSFDPSTVEIKPDYIFLTSIGEKWEEAYENVLSFAKESAIPIALSPGSVQLKDFNETLIKTLHESKMLFCNVDEAKKICEKLSGELIDDPKQLLEKLLEYGFDLLSITDGEKGAYALSVKDNVVYKIGVLETEVLEKTGAGDGYAAAFLASYLNGLPIEECMRRGAINSMGIISNLGAHTGQLRLEEMERRSNETGLHAETI